MPLKNRVTLIGHLGADPEVRSTNSGSRVATFNMATSERWKDKHTDEQRERTDWHRIAIFNEHLVKIAETYLRKGSHIALEGTLRTRKWQAQDGTDRYTTEVVLPNFDGEIQMLDKKGSGPGAPSGENDYGNGRTVTSPGTPDLDDEIPF